MGGIAGGEGGSVVASQARVTGTRIPSVQL